MTSVFRAHGVSVSFGGVRAVAGVDLEIESGDLIGPNGAGKTTFIDAVTGFGRSEGSVEKEFGALLPGIAQAGTAVLLVDHDMGLVLSACERVVVLDPGAITAQGTPAQVRGGERVVAAYLGHA